MIVGLLIILFWMGLVPLCIGTLITNWISDKTNFVLKSYLFGLVVFLAAFQVVIISNMFMINDFTVVCTHFSVLMMVLSVSGVVCTLFFKGKARNISKRVWNVEKSNVDRQKKIENLILVILFCVIVVFQLIQAVRLTYSDGDDAYYVGVATYGAYVEEMYSRIPYTGEYTEFDTRHCLAPFPYLISYLSRMSQIHVASIAHSILPVCFILFTYGIYYLIAKELCKEKREVSLFMLLASILFMFGNYSVYSMETFLMTRIRQGKASLGSFALPMAIYLLFLVAKKMDGSKKDRIVLYILLGCNGFVAALFTTMGNFIYPCLVLVGSVCICFGKKNWRKIFPLALTCVPNGVMALLYLIIR